MKVVSYSEASRLSGVSRQRITNMRKEHDKKIYARNFFTYDPKTGKRGVNIEHPDWKIYVDSGATKRVNKKKYSDISDSKHNVNQQPNSKERDLRKQLEKKDALIIQFVSTCIDVATDYFKASSKQIEEFKGLIAREFEGMDG